MERKENDYRKICFYCASIYEERDKKILNCPVCGKTIHGLNQIGIKNRYVSAGA